MDWNGLECDAVVHLRNGTSGLVEVKLGGETLIEEDAKTLDELSELIDTSRQKEVAFKMIVTASGTMPISVGTTSLSVPCRLCDRKRGGTTDLFEESGFVMKKGK